jgi:two-component system phosphate regulon response regulator PhoB
MTTDGNNGDSRPAVLIVDDDPVMRRLLAQKVSLLGHAAKLCSSADEVLAMMAAESMPSLMLVDWIMPGLSGLQLVSLVRKASAQPTYIIMVTSRSKPEDIVAALRHGVDDFIPKPFDDTELASRLAVATRALDKARDAGAA